MFHQRRLRRVLLWGAALYVAWQAWHAWTKTQPPYYLSRAAEAARQRDRPTQGDCLQALVRRFPRHVQGRLELADWHLRESQFLSGKKAEEERARGLAHLARAAECDPSNLPLQRRALDRLLADGRVNDAAIIARRIPASPRPHAPALLALAWDAVQAGDRRRAEELLTALEALPDRPVFQTIALRVAHLQGGKEGGDGDLLEDAARRVAAAADTPEPLSDQEWDAVVRLLESSVAKAPSPEDACRRAALALDAFEQLVARNPLRRQAAVERASRMARVADALFPGAAVDEARQALQRRIDAERSLALQEGWATAAVLRDAALAQIAQGEDDRARELLERELDDPRRWGDSPANLALLHYLSARQSAWAGDAEGEGLGQPLPPGWSAALAGVRQLGADQPAGAWERLSHAHRLQGASPPLHAGLAMAALSLERWPEASAHVEALAKAAPPEASDWIKRAQLRVALAQDRQPQAEALLGELKDSPAAAEATAMFAQWLANEGRADEALLRIEQAHPRWPDDPWLTGCHVSLLLEAGRAGEAEPIVQAALRSSSLSVALAALRPMIHHRRLEEALSHCETLRERFGDDPRLREAEGLSLLLAGRSEEALAALQDASSRGEPMARLLSAAALDELGRTAEALDALSLPGGQASPEMRLAAAVVASQQRRWSDVVALTADLLPQRTLGEPAQRLLLEAVASSEAPEVARDAVAALSRASAQPWLGIVKADSCARAQDMAGALAWLRRVDSRVADDSLAPLAMARWWLAQGAAQRALAHARRAWERDPQNPAVLTTAARLHAIVAQHDIALRHAEAALDQSPDSEAMAALVATCLERLGRRREAIARLEARFERQAEAAAGEPAAALQLVRLLHQEGQAKRAWERLRQARRAAPEDAGLACEEVFLLRSEGRAAEASQAAEALLSRDAAPLGRAERALAVARAFARAQDWKTARQFAEQSLARLEGAEAWRARQALGEIALAEALGGARDGFVEARDHFLAVLAAQPGHRVAGNNLAWLWTTQFDEPEKAIELCLSLSGAGPPEEMPPTLIETLAAAYEKAGRHAEADRLLSRALAARPDEARLHARLQLSRNERLDEGAAGDGSRAPSRRALP